MIWHMQKKVITYCVILPSRLSYIYWLFTLILRRCLTRFWIWLWKFYSFTLTALSFLRFYSPQSETINSCFWLVNILLGKYEYFIKKRNENDKSTNFILINKKETPKKYKKALSNIFLWIRPTDLWCNRLQTSEIAKICWFHEHLLHYLEKTCAGGEVRHVSLEITKSKTSCAFQLKQIKKESYCTKLARQLLLPWNVVGTF